MAILKPRSRILSIRVSEEEFRTLTRLRSVFGARSLSDLARDCIQKVLNGSGQEDVLYSRIDELHVSLKKIDNKIDRIAAVLLPRPNGDGDRS